jgi:hypothetical protein
MADPLVANKGYADSRAIFKKIAVHYQDFSGLF